MDKIHVYFQLNCQFSHSFKSGECYLFSILHKIYPKKNERTIKCLRGDNFFSGNYCSFWSYYSFFLIILGLPVLLKLISHSFQS